MCPDYPICSSCHCFQLVVALLDDVASLCGVLAYQSFIYSASSYKQFAVWLDPAAAFIKQRDKRMSDQQPAM